MAKKRSKNTGRKTGARRRNTQKGRTTKTKAGSTSSQKLVGNRNYAFTALAAASTVSVTVEGKVGAGGLFSAKLNRKSLEFQNDEAHAVVGEHQTNTLTWRVLGGAGTTWSIRVTKPSDVDCGDSGTLDGAGKEAGSCDFQS